MTSLRFAMLEAASDPGATLTSLSYVSSRSPNDEIFKIYCQIFQT